MALLTKPSMQQIWASGGDIVEPSDLKKQQGWTVEVPPHQFENWIQNRQDEYLAHINQRGIPEWDGNTEYEAAGLSYVQGSNGTVYKSVAASGPTGVVQDPTTDVGDVYWTVAFIDQTFLAAALNAAGPVVGASRNAFMRVASVSSVATLSADEVIVATSLAGSRYKLSSFSKSVNLATTGVGGMDTGTAPVSGYVALYAIYNPITLTSNLLAVNATAGVAPSVYGGANMPAGYTASALVSVWPTTAAGLFNIGTMRGRRISRPPVIVLNTSVGTGVLTTLSVSSAIPLNASACRGIVGVASAAGSNNTAIIASDAQSVGYQYTSQGPGTGLSGNWEIDLTTAQTIFYQMAVTASGTFIIQISSYEF